MSDFNADKSNKYQDTRSFPKSGLSAGVEDGLSMVEALPRGVAQAEQQTKGPNFRQESKDTPMAEDGKNFTLRY